MTRICSPSSPTRRRRFPSRTSSTTCTSSAAPAWCPRPPSGCGRTASSSRTRGGRRSGRCRAQRRRRHHGDEGPAPRLCDPRGHLGQGRDRRGLGQGRFRRHDRVGQGRVDRRHRGECARLPQCPQPDGAHCAADQRSRSNQRSRSIGQPAMTTVRIAVLPGDGIGQEVTVEAVRVLHSVAKATGLGFEFEQGLIGGSAIDAAGTPLPAATLDLVRKAQAILFGAVGGPKWDHLPQEQRAERGLLALRKELDLFANLRPARCFPMLVDASPLKRSVVDGTDIIVIRELTGGLYFGEPRGVERTADGARAVNTMVYTTREIERVARVGFDVARKRRKHLTSVDKANVLVVSTLWREVVTRVAKDYPDVTLDHVLVDNCAMALVHKPTQFDTIVTENTFGDILSDEAAILAGSMGMLPSASLGPAGAGRGAVGLYEPVHGTAPDIAGKGVANPIAAILSAAMLLRYSLDRGTDADRIEQAVLRVLEQGHRTGDIAARGEKVIGTKEMGDLIVRAVESQY